MPKLGDFLGHLLTESTMARVRADLESVRIAELYANHPLLKHMPVPRFRLPTVRFEIPVVIRGEDAGGDAETPVMDAEEAADSFMGVLGRVLEVHGERLLPEESRTIRDAAVATVREHLELTPYVAVNVTGPVNDLVKMVIRTIRPRLAGAPNGEGEPEEGADAGERRLSAIREDVRRRVMISFLRFLASPRRLEADITTNHVKEAGGSETLARIRMEVTEDGVEWATVSDRDGEPGTRLVSE
ncbi:MAG: hypothetical protein OXI84_09675 [bacterium]|nr:hypothetical protein [bacterium]